MITNMRCLSFTAIFQALAILLVAVAQVGAGPLSVQRRKALDVFNPVIVEPTASSNWVAGAQELVSWDTSDAPQSISNQGHVVLKTTPADSNEVSQWRHLAGPFDLTIGQINVTVPNDMITGQYKVILFGDSGNESPAFHVDGVNGTDGQQPPSDNDDPFGTDESHTHNFLDIFKGN
ncbi:hypothetical protein D9756_001271 [Leucocoprinus leucothites]|uniref:Uncharacterized protein n=1 Tax=Leucocoprinus leucothites TaxID=201217 RepID=A0A8H5G4K7_9AGAR|nr:hypothetical protein D9756_001271 [Leucoagaricus leucothites]